MKVCTSKKESAAANKARCEGEMRFDLGDQMFRFFSMKENFADHFADQKGQPCFTITLTGNH